MRFGLDVRELVARLVISNIQTRNLVGLLFRRRHGMKIDDVLAREVEAVRLHPSENIPITSSGYFMAREGA